MSRNPPWTRDELILALDLYFRLNPIHVSEQHPEIQSLSKLLNRLPCQGGAPDPARYRNPNGVYMKLCNYLRFDPSYAGKGLRRGGKLEQQIWEEYAGDRPRLAAVAKAIRVAIGTSGKLPPETLPLSDEDEEFPEGGVLTSMHRRRERNPKISRRKKESVLAATGALRCEVCDFDFSGAYGELGSGFAECHHRQPLSALPNSRTTRLTDLAIVCANCHRMLHRSKPMLTVEQLAVIVQKNTS